MTLNRLEGLEVQEVSLVDDPAVPDAKYLIVKRNHPQVPNQALSDTDNLNFAERLGKAIVGLMGGQPADEATRTQIAKAIADAEAEGETEKARAKCPECGEFLTEGEEHEHKSTKSAESEAEGESAEAETEKAADEPAASESAEGETETEKAAEGDSAEAETEATEKSEATNDIISGALIMDQIEYLLNEEVAEGDNPEGVNQLKAALAAVGAFVTAETAEAVPAQKSADEQRERFEQTVNDIGATVKALNESVSALTEALSKSLDAQNDLAKRVEDMETRKGVSKRLNGSEVESKSKGAFESVIFGG